MSPYDADEEGRKNAVPFGRGGIAYGPSKQRLALGQVGTIVEQLDDKTLLVEFSDDQGRAYAVVTCPREDLLVLHYVPEAA